MLKTEYLEYQDGDTVLEAYIAYDENADAPQPCVLVAHDWSCLLYTSPSPRDRG